MKKIILPIIVAIALLIGVPGTSLARKGHGHYKHNHGKHYKHGHYYKRGYYKPYAYSPRTYIGYYAPASPVYYAPPPTYYAPYYPPVPGQLSIGIVID